MGNPIQMFPGFTSRGVISPAVLELATQFNFEGIDALSGVPEKAVRWGDIGTRVSLSSGVGQVSIPVRLSSMFGFKPFEGERHYNQVSVSRIATTVAPFQLNFEWPLDLMKNPSAAEVYGFSGLASDIVAGARLHKCNTLASILFEGFKSATIAASYGSYGANGRATTIDQPGYTAAAATALPLFSGGIAYDGTTEITAKHFANPLDANSPRFANLFYGIGKLTDSACARTVAGQMSTGDSVFGTMLTRMSQVPHPTFADMTLGLEVTDLVGPTWMLIPFWQAAIQQLSLAVSGSAVAATTNIYNPDRVKEAGAEALMGAAGLAPWRFWIAPQLDAHPYAKANAGKQFWFAVSQSKKSLTWAELAATSKEYVPKVTLLGDGTEEATKYDKVRLISDLKSGGAAGLPHCIQMYTETAPAS